MLDTTLVGADGRAPFCVGFSDEARRFVHVLGDTTFDLLLRALDTITDFVDYLVAKEALCTSPTIVLATGEEDLLARYLRLVDQNAQKHSFKLPSDVNGVAITEGEWEAFASSAAAISQQHADEVSYFWDSLIEKFAKDAFCGGIPISRPGQDAQNIEPALRLMASEPRTARRLLASSLRELVSTAKKGRSVRLMKPVRSGGPAYIFMTLEQPAGLPRDEYREVRQALLLGCCEVSKLKLPHVTHFVGIATEPGLSGPKTEDLAAFDSSAWSPEDETRVGLLQKEHRILANATEHQYRLREYPNESSRPLVPMGARRNPRNCGCSCGSGLKYKKCCGLRK